MSHVVTLSSKFQLVIPKQIREAGGIEAGQKFVVVPRGRVVCLVPLVDIREMQERFRGADTQVRDHDDRP